MPSVQSVSVLLPTLQGAPWLERVLAALADQELEIPWDLHIIDSDSTDGTLEIVRRCRASFPVPLALRSIHPLEFDHGDTRNELAALSRGELLVYLVQDAIPEGSDWLAGLVRNFDDPRVGAAYCRSVPRRDASPVVRLLTGEDPGFAIGRREVRLPEPDVYAAMTAQEKRILYDLNDVASALRRELWEKHPFPRTCFGEDVLMSRALLEAGYTVVYDDEIVVEHSHEYTVEEARARARIDGEFNARWLDRICIESSGQARSLERRLRETDRAKLSTETLPGESLEEALASAHAMRKAIFEGLREGGRTAKRRPGTKLLEGGPLRVLYVVHGFPPDTWAGTEVYTLGLAREVQKLGHRCAVLTRAPADRSEAEGGAADFSTAKDGFEGLEVWRMTRRVGEQRLGHSFRHPAAEEVFRQVLAEFRPDVVHFQHLLHLSAELPRIAREAGISTVITGNDYWALCARVQLIRPGGEAPPLRRRPRPGRPARRSGPAHQDARGECAGDGVPLPGALLPRALIDATTGEAEPEAHPPALAPPADGKTGSSARRPRRTSDDPAEE